MKLLILGASGLIGGNLFKHAKEFLKWEAVGTYFSYPASSCEYYNTLDHQDPKNFDLSNFQPDAVIHCGALTWVDYCESHEEESYNKTVASTLSALELAEKFNAHFVYLSTDYVFDGKSGPYFEIEKLNPLSVYGKHKLAAERAVLESGLKSLILRVTNVYGDEERGKNFISRLIKTAQTKEEQAFKFPTDQYATPVNAKDVARAIGHLLKDQKQGIYNIASTDYLNRYQLAHRVLKYFPDHNITIEPILTADLNQEAKRPLYGGLISDKFLSEYPTFGFTNVDDYVSNFMKIK